MFYPQEMTQLQMIVPASDLLTVTKGLAQQEVFHQIESHVPVESRAPAETPHGLTNGWSDKAAAYAALEHRTQTLMQVLEVATGPAPSAEIAAPAELAQVQLRVEQIDQRVKQAREQLAENEKRLEQLQAMLDQLEPIAGVDVDFGRMRQSGHIHAILGVIPVANIGRFQTSLERIPFVLVTLRQDAEKAVVWLAGPTRNADVLDRAARSAYLNPLNLPEAYQGTPANIISSLRADSQAILAQIEVQKAALAMLAGELAKPLQTLFWQLRVSRILAEAIGRYGQSRYTYFIEGWVPSLAAAETARKLKGASPNILIETSPSRRSDPKQNVPVALNNPRLIRSFQTLVTNYAHPRYQEIDPTFLLAVMFPFLFGAMFGDVGQGVVLVLLGQVLASRRVKPLISLSALGGVITGCGLTAIVFGFLYGSVFGFENVLPALLFRPMDNILLALVLAIAVGVTLLSVGFLVNIWNSGTVREWGRLLFDPHGVAGLALYWSLVGLAVEVASSRYPVPPAVLGLLALLAGLAVMFAEVLEPLVEGRHPEIEGGLAIYPFRALFEMFEVLIGLLSNSISFVRVGAFAVAHVGLSAVIFLLAGLVSPDHGLGYGIFIAFGNLFIIGFEGMIVGIQTMRLSYYEFFSKFFTGGGMRYEPLTLRPKP